MKIRHDTFIVERFPEYQKLLDRDLRDHRRNTAIRWVFFTCVLIFGMWCAAMFGGSA